MEPSEVLEILYPSRGTQLYTVNMSKLIALYVYNLFTVCMLCLNLKLKTNNCRLRSDPAFVLVPGAYQTVKTLFPQSSYLKDDENGPLTM